ncbi:MAG: hypothetical protein ABEJ55_09000 [Halanaeroarchaeum sp.]
MDSVPIDTPIIWVGLLVISATVLGSVLALPVVPPPDADRVAAVVDSVAASDRTGGREVPISATQQIKVDATTVSLRGRGGTAHATFYYGPVVPVTPTGPLQPVLHGAPPQTAFRNPTAFEQSLNRAGSAGGEWERAIGPLVVRRVSFGEVNGVLVGQ